MKPNTYRVKKALKHLSKNGPVPFLARMWEKLGPEKVSYSAWYKKYGMPLAAWREEFEAEKEGQLEYRPLISIVVPCYETNTAYLEELMYDCSNQSYQNWELCLADASSSTKVNKCVAKYCLDYMETRIFYKPLGENLGISENTNAALAMAKGEWICFMDHDDRLDLTALFALIAEITLNPMVELIYTDEDKFSSGKGKKEKYEQPHFKPEFSIDLLRSNNYITHFLCVKRELLERVGGFRKEFDGAQDYDFILRCCEEANVISHLKRVLYHWRIHEDSTSDNPMSKAYAYAAGERALKAHLERMGIKGAVSQMTDRMHFGFYRVRYMLHPVSSNEVSKNFIEIDAPDSAGKNRQAAEEKGEYLHFQNEHVESLNRNFNWYDIYGMLQRPEVGVMSGRLYYPNRRTRSIGLACGEEEGRVVSNVLDGLWPGQEGYLHKVLLQQNFSGANSEFMIMKKSVFEEIGGFDESLSGALADMDLCLRAKAAGYLTAYNPVLQGAYTKGYSPEREWSKRYPAEEMGLFRSRYKDVLKEGDPYYNGNFSMKNGLFTLKDGFFVSLDQET